MEIKTERLELRPITGDGIEALADLFTDETVKKTYMVPDFSTREEARNLACRIRGLSGEPGRYVAGIHLNGQLIGLLNETERTGDRIEMGYAILPQYHNQGYCTEALRGTIEYLFGQGFREIVAGAFEENTASLRVMEKSGMTPLEHRDTVEYRGRMHTCVYFAARKMA